MRWLQRWRESTIHRPARRLIHALRTSCYFLLGVVTIVVVRLLSGLRPRTPEQRHPARIVLLRPDRIGDLVLSLPAFQAVRDAFPSATITAVVTPRTAPLLRAHPVVDEVLSVEGDSLAELWRSWETIRRLRNAQPDLTIAVEASWNCGLLAWLTGAPQRLGWDFRGAGGFFTMRLPFRCATVKMHEVESNLELVKALGIPAPWRLPMIPVPPEARAWVRRWWQEQELPATGMWVLIHPGSRSAYTRWAPERFAVIADRLMERPEAHVLLLAGRGEQALVARVQSCMRHAPAVVQNLTIEQVAALLERMHLFIGNATGTTHLAAYLGPCVIEIIGGTHPLDCPERWGVLGERHRVVHTRPQDVVGHATDAWVGPEGLSHISAEDVWRAVQDVWPQCVMQAARSPS